MYFILVEKQFIEKEKKNKKKNKKMNNRKIKFVYEQKVSRVLLKLESSFPCVGRSPILSTASQELVVTFYWGLGH